MQRTKTDVALAEAEEAHADDPERAELVRRARRFKTSWVDLAEALTAARKHASWRSWGYDSLEAYAKAELRLKPETVDKLTGSYSFLKKRAPAVLDRDPLVEPMPSYHAVDFLRRAEDSEAAPRDAVEEIRRRVIDEAAPVTAVSRAYKDVVFPIDEGTKRERDLAGVRNVAKRLRELLSETHVVSRKLAGEVSESLDKLLASIEEKVEAA
ncbi:MAG: hypothetical protein ABSE49_26610 [Polyangiaceae bacterium]|jgi:hypothetical protein